jgi:hypothetical protein
MNVETILTEELQVVAGAVQPPPPPVAELVRLAERSRTRGRAGRVAAVVLVAAAVVVAIVIGSQVGRPTTAPPPAHHSKGATPLAVGEAPRIPYVLGTTLYLDGKPRPGTWLGVETAGDITLASRAAAPDNYADTDAVLFRDGAQVYVVRHVHSGPELSPRGTKLAWIEVVDGTPVLVVRDLAADRELGRLPLDTPVDPDVESAETVQSVDDGGTVSYGSVLVSHTWRPGTVPVDQGPPSPSQSPPGFPNVLELTMSPDQTWGAWLTDRRGRNVGNRTDYDGVLDGVTVQKPGDRGSRLTIPLPAGTDLRGVVWESSTDVLLTVADNAVGDRTHYVRCSRLNRQCEIARTPSTP